jgi:glycosyltransferase involved in cell wall biosynthesis
VATDVGGTREVIEHGVLGWLVREGSVQAIEAGLRTFLSEPTRFSTMAAAGRQRIEAEFDIGVRTRRQAEIYKELACVGG